WQTSPHPKRGSCRISGENVPACARSRCGNQVVTLSAIRLFLPGRSLIWAGRLWSGREQWIGQQVFQGPAMVREARHHRWGPIPIPGWGFLDLFVQSAGRPAKVIENDTQPSHGHMKQQFFGERVHFPSLAGIEMSL